MINARQSINQSINQKSKSPNQTSQHHTITNKKRNEKKTTNNYQIKRILMYIKKLKKIEIEKRNEQAKLKKKIYKKKQKKIFTSSFVSMSRATQMWFT